MAHITDPDQGRILGLEAGPNWTWVKIIRLRDPSGPFGCEHTRVTGSDLLVDGGFESSFGFGPNGNEIPGFGDVGGLEFPFLNWSDQSPAPGPVNMMYQQDIAGTATPWVVSTADPHSGTYHLRQTMSNETVRNSLYLGKQLVCPMLSTSYVESGSFVTWDILLSAMVEPGDTWELSFWAKVDVVTHSNRFEVIWAVTDGVDEAAEQGIIPTPVLTTTYTQYTVSDTIDSVELLGFEPGPFFIRIDNAFTSGSGVVTIDLDDITFSLTPA